MTNDHYLLSYVNSPQEQIDHYKIRFLLHKYIYLLHKVLIPVRSGAGLRLGVNAGYMRFREKGSWIPF